MTQSTNSKLWLLLALTPKVGPLTILKLIKHFGSIENIFNQNHAVLSTIVNGAVARLILNRVAEEQVNLSLEWVEAATNHHIITLGDSSYPKALAEINDAPAFLFLKGNIDRLTQNKFAIIGSSHPSEYGLNNAYRFAKDLANNNLTIVSGMTQGINRSAHMGAIDEIGSTIGIIGTGIDQMHLNHHNDLCDQILNKNGLIISEFPLNTPLQTNSLQRRSRIIAGLSMGLLVVESSIDGGSMIAADMALEMGREVMAMPGLIHTSSARGCHKLIKSGAKLIENVNDILEDLRINTISMTYNPSKETNPILANMGLEPISIDQICANLNLDFSDICAGILELELSGEIINHGSGQYQRIFTNK